MTIEYDDFMKQTIYPRYYKGNENGEKNIVPNRGRIAFVSKESLERNGNRRQSTSSMSKMPDTPDSEDYGESRIPIEDDREM